MNKVGPLSIKQGEIISNAINERSKENDPCPNCGKTPSMVVPYVLPLAITAKGVVMQRYLPVAMTVCSICGFLRMFSMRELGLEDMAPAGEEESGND